MKVLGESFKYIKESYKKIYDDSESCVPIGKTSEWLIDNFYILEQEEKEIKELFKHANKKYIRFSADETVIYALAKKLVEQSGLRVDGEAVHDFLEKEQETKSLSSEELKIFLSEVKCALLEKIATLCKSIQTGIDKGGEEVNMANAIKSLISLKDVDWGEEFYAISQVDKILSRDKSGFYLNMSVETKELYRKNISKIARKIKKDEAYAAEQAVELAQKGEGKAAHVGYYIADEGENELLKALGLPPRKKIKKAVIYMVFIFVFTFAVLTLIYCYTKSFWGTVLAGIPVFDIWLNIANYISSRLITPKTLPALEIKDEIPETGKTMIVYPVLLSSAENAKKMAEKLEVCYFANKDDNLRFALLGDFKDGENLSEAEDEGIINAAGRVIEKLNKKHGDKFYFFHRERIYNTVQKKWMGWERKRGALISLNGFLRGKGNFEYIFGNTENLENIKYIITLDADTILPIGAAKKLIGAALHPLNKAVIDKEKGIVTEGYGIISPRISVDIHSANNTMFSRVFAGQGGTDTYSSSVSDIYMDLAGEAVFTGKGLYDIDVFMACIENAIPENRILSHDLLESCFARCAFASNIEVYDSYPATFLSYATRYHRWVRGDWQLLPWIFSKVKNKTGRTVRNYISYISKWKIGDNMRRSLTGVFQTLLIICSLSFLRYSDLWLSVALFSICLPMFLYLLSSMFSKNFFYIGEKRNSNIIYGFRSWLYQITLTIMFLPYVSFLSADAVVRTITRVMFTRKNTLEWVTAAESDKGNSKDVLGHYRKMAVSVIAAAVILWLSAVAAPEHTGIALIFAVIWSGAPLMAFLIGREETEKTVLPKKGEVMLCDTARRIWRFFEEYMNAEDNFLPPDNIQLSPYKGAAHRTSPTNIGLGMIAALSAVDLGFISAETMAYRLAKTLDTIEKLEKWRGHLYNWYDTKTLKPLSPRYISTVDSGNLLCYLMVCKKGVLEHKNDIGDAAQSIARRIEKLCGNMSFEPLYNPKKKLFWIGYNMDENRYANSYYDLLASEVRQSVFLSIARGEISKDSWFKLGRNLTSSDGYRGLLSWTGTMFEYLMPLLIMGTHKNTMLDETYWFAVRCHKKYARKRRVPWGVSESGYSALDVNMNYKYKAFGVPVLGLKRGLNEDTVISPYSTMLALMVDVKGALHNLFVLKRNGAMGEYGFYEAVDYTKSRVDSDNGQVVKSYMAHHQGMSLMAICNVLKDNIMQKRFGSYPEVKAAQPLLWERVPVKVAIKREERQKLPGKNLKPCWNTRGELVRTFEKDEYALPALHALSNGSYSLLIDIKGNGFSSLDGIRMSKFEPDPRADKSGQRVFIKDVQSGEIIDAYDGRCTFSPHMAEYKAETGDVESTLAVCLSPEESAEVRRLTVINNSKQAKRFEIITYTELSLSDYASESSHKAFSNLFVKTNYEDGVLYAGRRARGGERTFTAYSAMVYDDTGQKTQYESSRAAFLGRANTIDNADMLYQGVPFTGTVGSVIDPCFAFKILLEIQPMESASVTLYSGMGESEETAKSAVQRLIKSVNEDVFAQAYHKAKSERYIEFSEGDEEAFTEALPQLVYGGFAGEEVQKCLLDNKLPWEELWKMGISGDFPIVLVKISQLEDERVLSMMLRGHEYWRLKGLTCDLIALCDESGYQSPVYDMAKETVKKLSEDMEDISGGVKILSGKDVSDEDKTLLTAKACLYVDAAKGGLKSGIVKLEKLAYHIHKNTKTADGQYNHDLKFSNGYGGFDVQNKEYVIKQNVRGKTPAPWINVVANPCFGFIAGESGSGYTWCKNSRENRLTMWHNDSVVDPVTEKLYIECGEDEWSPYAGVYDDEGCFYTRHGSGYTKYLRKTRDVEHEVTLFVPVHEKIKIIMLRLKNLSPEEKKLKTTYLLAPVMGNSIAQMRGSHIAKLQEDGTVIVKNAFSKTGEHMFLAVNDGTGAIYDSDTLQKQGQICSGRPIEISVCKDLLLGSGQEEFVIFTLGAGDSEEACVSLASKYKDYNTVWDSFEQVNKYWSGLLQTVQVNTPSETLNIMLGSYLVYQSIACRIYARSAHYQSGGAYGFRDQLQDSLAALYAASHLTKNQILMHAAHQFTEGDALHWWHPSDTGGMARGVRTRFSDDRLWLAYLVAEYIKITGDNTVLDDTAPFLSDEPLDEYEVERYKEPRGTDGEGSIYEHAVRAIDISLKTGPNSLPLMGGGDWNDGMNTVGKEGSGESVWLAWFIIDILKKFIPLCRLKNDEERAKRYENQVDLLSKAAEAAGWDGEWYKRAFFDDGTPLGSSQNAECTIDSISQSWAVISGAADTARSKQAMESVEKMLWDKANKIVKLLSPPFEKTIPSPGYIKGYLPGTRENGGQYTHAAVWFAVAYSSMGDNDKALDLFEVLCPINHSKTDILANIYKVEPYVMAADVYSMPPHVGRGGWTWYTGAAAWMYKLGLEYVLGFRKEGDEVYFEGSMPKSWKEYEVRYKYKDTQYIFKVKKGEEKKRIKLENDGQTHEIILGRG